MKQCDNNLLNFALCLLLNASLECSTSQAMENPLIFELANIESTSLSLKGRKIGDTEAQVLARNTTLTSLDLSDNEVGDVGAQSLARNTRLTSLDLSNNKIRDVGAQSLAKNTTLTSLNLENNNVGVTGARALLTSLRAQTNLIKLSLNWPSNTNKAEVERLLDCNRAMLENNAQQISSRASFFGAQTVQKTSMQSIDVKNKDTPLASRRRRRVNPFLQDVDSVEGATCFKNMNVSQPNSPTYVNKKLTDGREQELSSSITAPTLPPPIKEASLPTVISPALPDKSAETKIDKQKQHHELSEFFASLLNKGPKPAAIIRRQQETISASQSLKGFETPPSHLDPSQAKIQQLEKEKAQVEETLSSVMQAHSSAMQAYNDLLEQQSILATSYQRVFELLQEAADQKNPLIQMALGLSYQMELVPSPRPTVAVEYFAEALAQGENRAFTFIQQEAEKGEKEAQYLLGQAYEKGQGTEENIKQAVTWYSKAAHQHHSLAQKRLTALQTIELEEAAQKGDRQAQFKLAQAYYQGNTIPQDLQKAVFWLEKAADQDQPQALLMLAEIYKLGSGVNQNLVKAIKLYQKALLHNQEEALTALNTLASQGIVEAQYALGQAYEKGQGTPRDASKALHWYEIAAQEHYSPASFALGTMAEEGLYMNFTTARTIIEAYERAASLYMDAQRGGMTESAEAITRVQQTLRGLHSIKEPEIRRNLLLNKLRKALPSPLAPDLLYYAAHLTGVMRMAFTEGPQEALMQALQGLAQFPNQSQQARAIMQVLLNLVEADEFHENALGEDEDAFRLSELGRICQGIHSIQNPTELVMPSQLPFRLKVSSAGLRDVRIEVFNCLFRTPQVSCDWTAFDQTVERLVQQFDAGVASGKITRDMLYDDEYDQHGDRTHLKGLLRGVKIGRPSERFAHRMLKIESLLMHKLDEASRYAQLASWAIAGIHCSTRAEKETYDFYHHHVTDTQTMEQEEATLEMRLALTLSDLRKSLVSDLVPQDESERIHQIAHLEKKVAQPLALVGDAQEFEDRLQLVVKSRYKDMSLESIVTLVKQKYTPEKMAEYIVKEVNKREGSRLPYSVLSKAFEQRQASDKLEEFYDEYMTSFTVQGAQALLYSTGYLERG